MPFDRANLHHVLDLLLDVLEQREEASERLLTSRTPPPGVSTSLFNRICRSGEVVGATKVAGRGAGVWTCTRQAWCAARTKRPKLSLVTAPKADSEAELADKLIEQAGFRLSRGGR